MEDREDFNSISEGMVSEFRWEPCMNKHVISYSLKSTGFFDV
jgi:hypothetical protein